MNWYLKALDTILWLFKNKNTSSSGGNSIVWTKLKKPPLSKKKGGVRELKLYLKRIWMTEKSTVGQLYINDKYECYILEDYDRLSKGKEKVYGETAIPRGIYPIKLTYSPKFRKILPCIQGVPGFRGIRIHAGNTAKDTEGCLLPGVTRSKNFVGQSKRAFNKLYKQFQTAKRSKQNISIEID